MRRPIVSAALLLVFGLLAACGQKGPLYLPTKAAAPASASPAAATSAGWPASATTAATPAPASSGGG